MKAIKRAILIFGTQEKLGAAIGVSQSAVGKWVHDWPIPDNKCVQIEYATFGVVTRRELNPSIDWDMYENPAPRLGKEALWHDPNYQQMRDLAKSQKCG